MDLTDPLLLGALGLGLGVTLALAVMGWRRRRGGGVEGAPKANRDDLDTLTSWQPQATRVLTDPERAAHRVLSRAFPQHLVLAQVPIARFLRVPTRHSYREWLRRVGGQCADLVICDSSTQVLAVVSVRPARVQSERAIRRQARLSRVLEAAQIPLYFWMDGALPSVEGARRQIELALLPEADEPEPVLVEVDADGGPSSMRPLPRRSTPHPMEVPLPDEVTELREPPASTWFDDLDSRATPLDDTPSKPGKR